MRTIYSSVLSMLSQSKREAWSFKDYTYCIKVLREERKHSFRTCKSDSKHTHTVSEKEWERGERAQRERQNEWEVESVKDWLRKR